LSVIIMEIVTVWETGEVHTEFWWGNLRKREHLEDLGVDGEDITMHLPEVGGVWTYLSGSGSGQVAGFCECGNEL
jgi:hypothetical protein